MSVEANALAVQFEEAASRLERAAEVLRLEAKRVSSIPLTEVAAEYVGASGFTARFAEVVGCADEVLAAVTSAAGVVDALRGLGPKA